MNKIINSYNHDLKKLKDVINNTNKDITEFNKTLPNYIKEAVEKKKKLNIIYLILIMKKSYEE